MLIRIIWLITLIGLLILNAIFVFKNKGKAFLNLIACIFVFLAILIQINIIKDYQPEKDIKTKVELENGKEKKIRIAGISINCPKCDTKIWSEENFCKKCGYKKSISEFDENECRNFILYYCPYCKEITTSSNDFCANCGKSLIDVKKEVIKELKSH